MTAGRKTREGAPGDDRGDVDNGERPTRWEPEPLVENNSDPVSIVDSLQQQVDTLRTQLARVTAEFDNFRKRTQGEKKKTLTYATEALVVQLLPVLDDFERAVCHMDEEVDSQEVFDGLRMVRDRLVSTLEKQGVASFSGEGETFNPYRHEAVQIHDRAGEQPNSVVECYQAGYQYHDRIIRAAQVIITPRAKVPPKPPAVELPPPPTVKAEPSESEDDGITHAEGIIIEVEPVPDPETPPEEELLAGVEVIDESELEELQEELSGHAQKNFDDEEKTTVSPPPSGTDWEVDDIGFEDAQDKTES